MHIGFGGAGGSRRSGFLFAVCMFAAQVHPSMADDSGCVSDAVNFLSCHHEQPGYPDCLEGVAGVCIDLDGLFLCHRIGYGGCITARRFSWINITLLTGYITSEEKMSRRDEKSSAAAYLPMHSIAAARKLFLDHSRRFWYHECGHTIKR